MQVIHNQPLKVIIIDDEEGGISVLKKEIEQDCTGVSVIGTANSVESGYELIQTKQPDLVFLDIELRPGLGFDIIKKFQGAINFQVIFVTAYQEYAITAIRFAAIDYLLKTSYHIQELQAAIDRARQKIMDQYQNSQTQTQLAALLQSIDRNTLDTYVINTVGRSYIIKLEDIIAVQSNGATSDIYIRGIGKINSGHAIKKYKDDFKHLASFHSSCIFNWAYFKYAVREDGQYFIVLDCETKHREWLKLPVAIHNDIHFRKALELNKIF